MNHHTIRVSTMIKQRTIEASAFRSISDRVAPVLSVVSKSPVPRRRQHVHLPIAAVPRRLGHRLVPIRNLIRHHRDDHHAAKHADARERAREPTDSPAFVDAEHLAKHPLHAPRREPLGHASRPSRLVRSLKRVRVTPSLGDAHARVVVRLGGGDDSNHRPDARPRERVVPVRLLLLLPSSLHVIRLCQQKAVNLVEHEPGERLANHHRPVAEPREVAPFVNVVRLRGGAHPRRSFIRPEAGFLRRVVDGVLGVLSRRPILGILGPRRLTRVRVHVPAHPELGHDGRRRAVRVEVVVGHDRERQRRGPVFVNLRKRVDPRGSGERAAIHVPRGLRPRQTVVAVEGEQEPARHPVAVHAERPPGRRANLHRAVRLAPVHKNRESPIRGGGGVRQLAPVGDSRHLHRGDRPVVRRRLGLQVEEETLEGVDAGFTPGAHRRRRRRTKGENRSSQFAREPAAVERGHVHERLRAVVRGARTSQHRGGARDVGVLTAATPSESHQVIRREVERVLDADDHLSRVPRVPPLTPLPGSKVGDDDEGLGVDASAPVPQLSRPAADPRRLPRAPGPRSRFHRSPRRGLDARALVDARGPYAPRRVLDAVDPGEVLAVGIEREGHAKEPRVVVRQHPQRRTVEWRSHHAGPSARALREPQRETPRVLDGPARHRGLDSFTVKVPDVRRLERHRRQVSLAEARHLDRGFGPARMRVPMRVARARRRGIGARARR
mmetsp:Transcript_8256/g.33348  ORF Transcript_8256/g.33348 Transcript_8256/m.33348 type:complete len:723 (-) Transcript_8256:81-2249(-)